MAYSWKHTVGAFALSAAMLASSSSGIVEAKKGQKNDKIKDNGESVITDPCKRPGTQCDPRQGGSSAEKKGQKNDKIPDDPPEAATEKGIKDKGMTSCGNCGLTGREAAPPPVDDASAPATERNKSDTIKPDPPLAGQRNKSDTIKPDPPLAGQRNKSDKIKEGPPLLGLRNKTGWIIPVLGVASASALVALAAGGGSDNPTSPR